MLPLKGFSDYFFENKSVDAVNQLQITASCNARCIFCSNEQNPFKIHRPAFRTLEEIKKVLWAVESIPGPISLNESLPGRVSEGEALIHPQLFEILEFLRSKYSNIIKITTNGSLLDEDMIKELAKYNPISVRISIPSTNKENWIDTFTTLKEKHFNNAMNAFKLLKDYKINVSASMVPMPSWVGYDDIEQTIKFIKNSDIKHLLIYAPGYTKYTDESVIDKLQYDKIELSNFLDVMSHKYNLSIEWSLHPKKQLYINHDAILNTVRILVYQNVKNIYWYTSTAAYERFSKLLKTLCVGIPIINNVIPIKNKTYEGNIECTGLWMINDFTEHIPQHQDGPIIIPNAFLDKYGFDLEGNNITQLTDQYKNLVFI